MALVVYDRVQETTATTGTGTITLGGAVAGYQSFAVVGNGNTTYYCIVNSNAWEVGIGTYTSSGTTLARTTVLSNSNGNTSPITLSGASNVFVTYPSEVSVTQGSALGTPASGTLTNATGLPLTTGVTGTLPVANGGTGVTASSGANSVMLRDANQNVSINRLNQGSTTVTAAAGTTTLTAASTFSQILTGTGGQTFKLPDATTLTNTTAFEFNNNATGTLTIVDNASGAVGTITSGGAAAIALLSNGTVAGTWDVHAYIPENVQWGTNSLALGSTVISGGTWQGGTIASGYGGTGLTTFSAANNAIYSTSASALAAGTLPVLAGGTGVTTSTGSGNNVLSTSPTLVTPVLGTPSSGTLTSCTGLPLTTGVTGTLPVGNGGTGATTLTSNGVVYGNGTSAAGITAAGTTGQVLIATTSGAPSWGAIPTTAAVTSFSAGTTGFTPSSATTGVVTLAGTLNVANGGTGLTTLTAGYIPYGNGTSALSSSSSLYFSGSALGIGTSTPTTEAAATRLALVGTAAQDASTLATSNTKAVLSLRGDSSSGYSTSFGTLLTTNDQYIQGVNYSGGAASCNLVLQPFGGNVGIGTGTTTPSTALQLGDGTGTANDKTIRLWSGYPTSNTGVTGTLLYSSNISGGNQESVAAIKGQMGLSSNTNSLAFYVGDWNNSATLPASPYMVINTGGNVGIGTTTPGNQLNIVTTSNSVARQIGVRNTSAGSGAYSLIDIGNDTSGSAFDIGVLSSTNASYGGAGSAILLANTGNLYLSTTGAYAMQFATNGTERMRIDSSGNLGIGTAGGTYGFDLSRSTTNGSTIRIYNSTASSSFLLQNDTAGNAYVQQQFNGPLVFATNNAEKMRIFASGGVSIGNTTDPGATNLSVTGTVTATNHIGAATGLTGTASININGTVGATTANTGAFTGLTATSYLKVPSTSNPIVQLIANNQTSAFNCAMVNNWAAGSNGGVLIGTSEAAGTALVVSNSIPITSGLPTGTGTSLLTVAVTGSTFSTGVTATTGTFSSTLTQSGGYAYLGSYNAGTPTYPANNNSLAIANNFSGGSAEMNVWNTVFPSTYVNTGIRFQQLLTSSTQRDLMFLRNTGAVAFGGVSNYGTSGQVLTSGGDAAPTWTTPSTVNNGTLTMSVSGTGLSGSQTFTANQSSAATFTVTSNATNANTASTIVARDASGNFSAGTITATSFSASSDETLKENWDNLPNNFISNLAQVKYGSYNRIGNKTREVGVSAQSLEKVLKEVVIKSDDGLLGVNYGNAALVVALELAKEVVELRKEIELLKVR